MNPRFGRVRPQEWGFLRGEDVEVKEKAACSLFPERNPLLLKRRFFCNFSCRWWQEKLVINTPMNCNVTIQSIFQILIYRLVIIVPFLSTATENSHWLRQGNANASICSHQRNAAWGRRVLYIIRNAHKLAIHIMHEQSLHSPRPHPLWWASLTARHC